ncbi:Ig-like domain-containing protein [Streptomyces sp. NPDC059985]|uniref:Ig-like domain-containing protein n=1 Tax=Streptomyces sp. NPDC059985 TaxID=3347025 RepID=UPI0036B1446A
MKYRLRSVVVAAALASSSLALPVVAHAVTSASQPAPVSLPETSSTEKPSRANIEITPRDGSAGVPLRDGVSVTVHDGQLTSVEMRSISVGKVISGRISPDGKNWRPDISLARGTEYSIKVVAKSHMDDGVVTGESNFRTVDA